MSSLFSTSTQVQHLIFVYQLYVFLPIIKLYESLSFIDIDICLFSAIRLPPGGSDRWTVYLPICPTIRLSLRLPQSIRQEVRGSATSQKVAGSIHDGVIVIFH